MFKLLKVGHCFHPEAMVKSGASWKPVMFPSLVGLIRHPRWGNILFDTGYSERFNEATKTFPERFYRWTTPIQIPQKESLLGQLNGLGIGCEEINYVFISHFHADHIAGLRDFPAAKFICSKRAFEPFLKWNRFHRVSKGFLNRLLPEKFIERTMFIEDCQQINLPAHMKPFARGYDLFGDDGFISIDLPGHTLGHIGLLFHDGTHARFLVGDACWSADAYAKGIKPSALTGLVMADFSTYLETIDRLSLLYGNNQKLSLIPSHCMATFESLHCA